MVSRHAVPDRNRSSHAFVKPGTPSADIRVTRARGRGLAAPFRADVAQRGPPVKVEWCWRQTAPSRWWAGAGLSWVAAFGAAAFASLAASSIWGLLLVLSLLVLGDVLGARASAVRHGTAQLEVCGDALVLRGLPQGSLGAVHKDAISAVDVRPGVAHGRFEVHAVGACGDRIVLAEFVDDRYAAYLQALVREALRGVPAVSR